ncbi:MAG: winged helix-turn-helix domain-containing protein [Rhodospirillaceae bacterium]
MSQSSTPSDSRSTEAPESLPRLLARMRFKRDDSLVLGPGRVDLMQAIVATGSISAAARSMGMSYRRAWLLVEEINSAFARPLVASVSGGKHGGGARLTDTGRAVVAAYQRMVVAADKAMAHDRVLIEALLARTAPPATKKKSGTK